MVKFPWAHIIILWILLLFQPALGITPLTSLEGLKEPQQEQMWEVSGAQVLMADYQLIGQDFPWTRLWPTKNKVRQMKSE